MKPNLEHYLKHFFEKGIIDHTLRVSRIDEHGKPHFYIQPNPSNGTSLDFVVSENCITQKYKE
jgi:hypothetical protein